MTTLARNVPAYRFAGIVPAPGRFFVGTPRERRPYGHERKVLKSRGLQVGRTYGPPLHEFGVGRCNGRSLRLLQDGFFPALAGEEEDLFVFAQLPEQRHGLFQPPVVKTHQGIVQDQGRLRGQLLPEGQP